jgi:SAM-dependent methyltransferase
MSILSKSRWLFTYAGFLFLKRGLSRRAMEDIQLSRHTFPSGVRMVNRIDYVLDYCTGKKVLHVGFADHPDTAERVKNNKMLHLHLRKVCKFLYGFDNHPSAVRVYTELTEDKNTVCADLMQKPLDLPDDKDFEVILLGEVIEHLENPYQAIENLFESLPSGTIFMVTVPNYTSLDSIAGSVYQKESVHPDHHWYFSCYTLLKLFPPEKFDLQELLFGMYFQQGKLINAVLKRYPFMGDCIIGIFKSKKQA